MVGAALLSFLGAMEVCTRFIRTGSRNMLTVGIVLMVVAVVCAGIGGAILYVGLGKGTEAAGITTTTGSGASVMPPPSGDVLAEKASLRLLMRPNQDPLELSNDNIWRWYSFKTIGQNAETKQLFPIGTYFFLTFTHPIKTNYRRVFSASNADWHFDILDLTSRSMVIAINNVDVTGATIEIHVSGSPL